MAVVKKSKTLKKTYLKAFYAVTQTSVYLVKIGSDDPEEEVPALIKIARRGNSLVAVGATIFSDSSDSIIAVCRGLRLFLPFAPKGRDSLEYEREIAKVSTLCYVGSTSLIVALFLNEADALACSAMPNLQPCDPRWKEKTIATLRAIGEDHPYCSISTWPNLWLIPPSEWMDIAGDKKQ